MVFGQPKYLNIMLYIIVDVVYYDKVYKPPIIPWATELDDEGKHTRKTFYKY